MVLSASNALPSHATRCMEPGATSRKNTVRDRQSGDIEPGTDADRRASRRVETCNTLPRTIAYFACVLIDDQTAKGQGRAGEELRSKTHIDRHEGRLQQCRAVAGGFTEFIDCDALRSLPITLDRALEPRGINAQFFRKTCETFRLAPSEHHVEPREIALEGERLARRDLLFRLFDQRAIQDQPAFTLMLLGDFIAEPRAIGHSLTMRSPRRLTTMPSAQAFGGLMKRHAVTVSMRSVTPPAESPK